MAHEIDTTTGRASFAYTGQAPWHGLGKQLPEGTDLDAWAEAAGMNFTIKAAKALFVGEQKQTGQLKGQRILYRDDTNAGSQKCNGDDTNPAAYDDTGRS